MSSAARGAVVDQGSATAGSGQHLHGESSFRADLAAKAHSLPSI